MRATVKKYLKTTALSWVGCFLFFVCFYLILLSPQLKEKNQVQEHLDEKQQIFNSALQAARKDTKIKMQNEIKELRDNLGRFLIAPEELANLIFDISKMAKEKQVSSFSIESSDEKSSTRVPNCEYLGRSRIDLSFTSDFERFATLLNVLERNTPIVFIDKFSVQSTSTDKQSQPRVQMDLSVFVKKLKDS
jgi:Tfp pilus assembly protein PilO